MTQTNHAEHTTPHNRADLATVVPDLQVHLTGMHALLKQLTDAADVKLEGMRRADTETLRGCADREADLLQRVFDYAQGRPALVARVAQALHRDELKEVPLLQLADELPEPHAAALRAHSTALRQVSQELQRKNRIAARVAHNLQSHIHGIFADVAKVGQESCGYDVRGNPNVSTKRRWVDAVG